MDDVDWDFFRRFMRCITEKTTVSYMRRSPLGENVCRLEQDINAEMAFAGRIFFWQRYY